MNKPKKKKTTSTLAKQKKKPGVFAGSVKSPEAPASQGSALGVKMVKLTFTKAQLKITYPNGMKKDVLNRFFDNKKMLKDAKAINRIYRAAHGQQDELFSTALTREIVVGLFKANGNTTLVKSQMENWNEMIDLASSVRIPTELSGFATKDAVMQHPANRIRAVFDDPYATASLHSKLDTERRLYVEAAIQRALDSGITDGRVVMQEGVKASIEYTLNYFTAPITANNVLPYTRKAGFDVSDKTLQKQLAARERMKTRYIELGGKLRISTASTPETELQSLQRNWEIGRSAMEEPLIAPPSPRRGPVGGFI